jgi:hypothetical protein
LDAARHGVGAAGGGVRATRRGAVGVLSGGGVVADDLRRGRLRRYKRSAEPSATALDAAFIPDVNKLTGDKTR